MKNRKNCIILSLMIILSCLGFSFKGLADVINNQTGLSVNLVISEEQLPVIPAGKTLNISNSFLKSTVAKFDFSVFDPDDPQEVSCSNPSSCTLQIGSNCVITGNSVGFCCSNLSANFSINTTDGHTWNVVANGCNTMKKRHS